jgi:hypothetical protein
LEIAVDAPRQVRERERERDGDKASKLFGSRARVLPDEVDGGIGRALADRVFLEMEAIAP